MNGHVVATYDQTSGNRGFIRKVTLDTYLTLNNASTVIWDESQPDAKFNKVRFWNTLRKQMF